MFLSAVELLRSLWSLDITNLDKLSEGDQVNIEIDQNTITVVNTVKKTLATQISS